MVTYQALERYLLLEKDTNPEFPSNVLIKVTFDDARNFGENNQRLDYVLTDIDKDIILDHFSGRMYFEPKIEITKLKSEFYLDETNFSIDGNEITLKFLCSTEKEFYGVIFQLYFNIPHLFTLTLPFPVTVKYIKGFIGENKFNFNLKRIRCLKMELSCEDLIKRIEKPFYWIDLYSEKKNIRYAVALSYFYKSVRLLYAGYTYNEFMAEAILNYYKVLVTLFGESRDDVRKGLADLEYSDEDIETTFIPYMVLRNEFNVGHIFSSLLKRDEYNRIYEFLEYSIEDFRELLLKLRDKLETGEYSFLSEIDFKINSDKQHILNKLLMNISNKRKMEYKDRKITEYKVIGI